MVFSDWSPERVGVVLNTFIDAKHKCLITFKNGREHAEVRIF